MAQHGFHRRLSDLGHAQARLFEILPPDATAPSRRDLHDATAFLQAFVINVFGAIDNLAWVWACEADVRDDRGRPLRRSQIRLMPGGMQAQLRNSISATTQAYLETSKAWFGYLEEYRHALAHRIPLYIPPRHLDQAALTEFRRLGAEMAAVMDDPDRWQALKAERDQIGTFEPVMLHSSSECAVPVYLHAQWSLTSPP